MKRSTTEKKYDLKAVLTYSVSLSGVFAGDANIIKEPRDLSGKRVSVGPKGGAFLPEAEFVLRDCVGIWEQVKPEYIDFTQAKDAFMDKRIDATYCPAQWGGGDKFTLLPFMLEVLKLRQVNLVSFTKEELDKGNKVVGRSAAPIMIPAGSIQANVPQRDTLAIANQLLFWAPASADEKVIYEIVKMVYENRDKYAKYDVAFQSMMVSPESVAWFPSVSEAEVHPGALKYYKDKGIKVFVGGASPELKKK